MFTFENWMLLIPALPPVFIAVRWMYIKTKHAIIEQYEREKERKRLRKFVYDLGTNHLPHIYSALEQIADKQGIKLSDPPPVRFIEANGNGDKIT